MHPAKKNRYDCLGPRVVKALEARNFQAHYCSTSEEVLPLLLSLIQKDDVVSFGGSETLVGIGAIEAVRAAGYTLIDRGKAKSPEERMDMMRKALLADTYLTGTNAISEDGILFNVDGNGNRVAAMCFGPRRVIAVVGMNKVMPNREAAHARARGIAAPEVVQRFPGIKTPCITTGSCADCRSDACICSYVVETRMCRPKGRITVILVGEDLGL